MDLGLNPIIIPLDFETKQADIKIASWLKAIPSEKRKEFCLTLIGPWIENKKLYIQIVPRFVKGADMQWPEPEF